MLRCLGAALIIKEIERWRPKRFATSVTDSAANMVVAWRSVPEKVSKMVDVSYCRLKALYLWVTASLQGLQYS